MTTTTRPASQPRGRAHMPSDVSGEVGVFDRFATHASSIVSRAPFFAFCVVLVIVWAPTYFAFGNVDTWQLLINTATTIVTFLLVALLQNTESRSQQATDDKLNAIAAALAGLMEHTKDSHPALEQHIRELEEAVGLERRERSD